MRIVSKYARKRRIPRGKISVIELIEKVKGEKELSEFGKMEKVVNIAFEKIFNVCENDWERKKEIIDKWERKIKHNC